MDAGRRQATGWAAEEPEDTVPEYGMRCSTEYNTECSMKCNTQKKKSRIFGTFYLQKMGVEPTRYCYHTDLNRARLPIPPLLQEQ